MIKDLHDYKTKTKILKKMAHHYYVLDDPIASDDEYDRLYFELVEYEKNNPNDTDKTSPTQRVGSDIKENFEKIAHIERMWSLDDVFNLDVPQSCPGVPAEIMNPRDTWPDKAAYDESAKKLAKMFADNFAKKYPNMPKEIAEAGPKAE